MKDNSPATLAELWRRYDVCMKNLRILEDDRWAVAADTILMAVNTLTGGNYK
jgi:hypothetical protein